MACVHFIIVVTIFWTIDVTSSLTKSPNSSATVAKGNLNEYYVKRFTEENGFIDGSGKSDTQDTYGTPTPATRATNNGCKLQVTKKSISHFEHEVLKNWYNFVYMELDFKNLNISEKKDVIDRHHWVWTYKGVNGAHQYLFLPSAFGYLSLGLLWAKTRVTPMKLVLEAANNSSCNKLVIGENETDLAIGNALGDMTVTEMIARSNKFHTSYWCYNVRLYLHPYARYFACKNLVCTSQTIEYRCCKFRINYVTRKRTVECLKQNYRFGRLWWFLPMLIGEICFAFSPLVLANVGCKVSKKWRKSKRKQRNNSEQLESGTSTSSYGTTSRSTSVELQSVLEMAAVIREHSKPVTLTSTLISPLCRCGVNSKILYRVLRVMIILLPLTVTVIRVLLDYSYAKVFVQKAVRKGALLGFSSAIAGWDSKDDFLKPFWGPYVAVPIYVIFGCVFILLPYDLGALLERGIFHFGGSYMSPLSLSIDRKEKLSGLEITRAKGYNKLYKYLLAQLYVLLNWKFWTLTINMFTVRLTEMAYSAILRRSGCVCITKIAILALTPPYIAICILELAITCMLFAFPVHSCFFILLKAYIGAAIQWLEWRPRWVRWIARLLFIPLLIIFIFTWYMYCIIFCDGVWFLSKIVMFTYSGSIAYPKESYGYMILILMTMYYLFESFNDFGAGYQDLLRLSIEACQRLESRAAKNGAPIEILHHTGIPSVLFEVIIERHRPRRIQVLSTFLKFGAVLSILWISIELLLTFDKLQELSLITHVFTVIFICCVPKIIKSMCATTNQGRRKILKHKIMRTVDKHRQNEQTSEGDVFADDFSDRRAEYELLDGDD